MFYTLPIINYFHTEKDTYDFYEKITLPFDENDVQLKYTTINHKMGGSINYRYRFEKGEDWKETKERLINLVDIGNGEYSFEVQSQNEDNIWSDSTSITFVVKPPWWKTWWFGLISILLLGLIFLYFYRSRIKRLHNDFKLAEELRELEKSALQAQMNPHFIFNCLNSIQAFIMDNEKEQAMDFLGSFAQLIRSNLNASIESQITLFEEVRILENYLKLERLRLENRFEYNISVPEAVDPHTINLPPMLIQPFVENAVIHGMKHITENGRIDITFSVALDQLLVTIKDNGSKVPEQKSSDHKSVGIDITRKRLAHINQSKLSQVAVDVQHLDEGTTVKLAISLSPSL